MPRKVFTAGEILTAADVNTNLMDQAVMVFDDDDARAAAIPSPIEGMVTYLKDTDALEKFDGSAFAPVGTILQILQTVKTNTFSTSGTEFQAVTGLSVTITPSSTSSKIIVILDSNISITPNVSSNAVTYRLSGGNSDTYVGDASESRLRAIGHYGASGTNNVNFNHGERSLMPARATLLDSPATTSAVTYQMEIKVTGNTGFVNRSGSDSNGTSYARGASSITVMEVAG